MRTDWTEIEKDWRAGSMSIREIARFYGVPEATLRKKAKAGGWTRVARHITDAELRAAGGSPLATK